MAVIVGIDEAGFGPILGPLTASSVTFMLPDDQLSQDHWHILRDSVSKEKRGLKGRLLITDSKKAYNRKSGLGHLERTSLACLNSLGIQPDTVESLIASVAPDCLARLKRYEWYTRLSEKKIAGWSDDAQIASAALKRNLSQKNFTLLDMKSSCLDVGYYNGLVEKVQNKSSVLFTVICQHIQKAFEQFGDKGLQIVIDRQGGRTNYIPVLSKMFPECQLKVIKQDGTNSSYEFTQDGKMMKLHFCVKADDKCMAVSLASILSKYLRELMMETLNEHFIAKLPELKPTAGYWQDGLRFIADLEQQMPEIASKKQLLIRSR